MTLLTRKLPEWKAKKVEQIASEMQRSGTVGIVDVKGLPAREFHSLRNKFRDYMKIEVVKKVIIKLAIEKSKGSLKNIKLLEKALTGMPAIVVSQINPFKLSKIFSENKAPSFAKAGQIAQDDIVVSAGLTPFAPGPMLADLKSKGLKVKIEAGKIAIQEDAVVVKKGKKISADVADLLLKLGIKPMEVGFEFNGAWENEVLFNKDVLSFNAGEYLSRLEKASSDAFKLSIGLPYPTKKNISLLVSRAFNEAKVLAEDRDIFVDALAGEMLAKADAQAKGLSSYIDEKKPNEPKDNDKNEGE